MKIKSLKLQSTKLIVPFDGVINIDENGITDVSKECANALVNSTSDWIYLEEGTSTEKEKKDVSNSENPIDEEPKTEESEDEMDLSKLNYKQLREVAVESKFPEEEWSKLKKGDLIDYLYKKLGE